MLDDLLGCHCRGRPALRASTVPYGRPSRLKAVGLAFAPWLTKLLGHIGARPFGCWSVS